MAADKYVSLTAGKLKEKFGSVTGTANAIPAGDVTGRLDVSWMPVGSGPEVLTVVASEALTAGDFVSLWNNTGVLNVRKADATTNAKPAHGFVLSNVLLSGTATVYLLSNINTAEVGLTIASDYYLSTTPGGVTTTPPSATGNIVQRIGTATKTTELPFVNESTIEVA